MGFLSDLFSDKKEINRCNFYLTGFVMCLYEDMQIWLKGRIKPAISLNEHLAKSLATDEDRRNLQDAFNMLGNKFSNVEFNLYKV